MERRPAQELNPSFGREALRDRIQILKAEAEALEYLLSPFEQVEVIPPAVEQMFFSMAHGGFAMPQLGMSHGPVSNRTQSQLSSNALRSLGQRLQAERPTTVPSGPKVVELGDPTSELEFDEF